MPHVCGCYQEAVEMCKRIDAQDASSEAALLWCLNIDIVYILGPRQRWQHVLGCYLEVAPIHMQLHECVHYFVELLLVDDRRILDTLPLHDAFPTKGLHRCFAHPFRDRFFDGCGVAMLWNGEVSVLSHGQQVVG